MSLTESPDYLFRPEDKALKMLFPSTMEPVHNSFDDFFDGELYDLSTDDDNKASLTLDDFFTKDCVENPSPSKVVSITHGDNPQPWRKGIWCLNSKPTSDLVVGKTRKKSRIAQQFVSPMHLMSNENFATRSPTSPLSMNTKNISLSPKAATFDHGQNLRYAVAREQTLSPTPMYAQLPRKGEMNDVDRWQQDFQNFHLQMPGNGVYSSREHTERTIGHELTLRQANARTVARNATVAHPSQSPTKYHYPFNHVSRPVNSYPEIDISEPSGLEPATDLFRNRMEQLHHPTYSGPSMDQYVPPIWTAESLHSSDSSHYSHGSHYSAEDHRQAYQSLPLQNWMSSSSTAAPIFLPHEATSTIAAPIPQRAPHQILYQQQEQFYDGLGIHYAHADEIGRAVTYEPAQLQNVGYCAVTPPAVPTSFAAYPPLPPYPSHVFSDTSPFTTPRKQGNSVSRSPSPSISPTRRSASRGVGQRSPTRTDYAHSRRKSIHKPGPIKDASAQDGHRRTRSSSRPPRTPKTPKTPTSANFSQIGFVNFTPKDSAKLMNDVAPSGSSKTRARREQEAKEKRKRLSEAAMQAIRKAGGDVSALEKAIFV